MLMREAVALVRTCGAHQEGTGQARGRGRQARQGAHMSATKLSPFRIPEEVKKPAADRAAREDKTLTDVVKTLLERYGKGEIDA
jgi:hypothetical protein